ncbi:hypothetical protein NEAUS03_0274 [Nematocida ausubeli]|nr:hypothetical protein NEAUS03_0274 [Nematocida ausubeli]
MAAITHIFSLGKRYGIVKNMLVLELSKDISIVSMKPVIINSTDDPMEKMNLIAEYCKNKTLSMHTTICFQTLSCGFV